MAFRRETGHLEGVMRTERNQLASVGRLHIGSLSDALPEEEVFQSACLYRDGAAKPILAETLDCFTSQQSYLPMSGDKSFAACLCGLQKPHQQVQATAYSDRCHMQNESWILLSFVR
jgi:hypothetical protein